MAKVVSGEGVNIGTDGKRGGSGRLRYRTWDGGGSGGRGVGGRASSLGWGAIR